MGALFPPRLALGIGLCVLGVAGGFAVGIAANTETKFQNAQDAYMRELQKENQNYSEKLYEQKVKILELQSEGEKILTDLDLHSAKYRSPHHCPWGEVGTRFKYKNISIPITFNGRTTHLKSQEWGCPKS